MVVQDISAKQNIRLIFMSDQHNLFGQQRSDGQLDLERGN
jgi:hypothetical protein